MNLPVVVPPDHTIPETSISLCGILVLSGTPSSDPAARRCWPALARPPGAVPLSPAPLSQVLDAPALPQPCSGRVATLLLQLTASPPLPWLQRHSLIQGTSGASHCQSSLMFQGLLQSLGLNILDILGTLLSNNASFDIFPVRLRTTLHSHSVPLCPWSAPPGTTLLPSLPAYSFHVWKPPPPGSLPLLLQQKHSCPALNSIAYCVILSVHFRS